MKVVLVLGWVAGAPQPGTSQVYIGVVLLVEARVRHRHAIDHGLVVTEQHLQ